LNDIRVLILGTGGMANAHAEAYAAMKNVQIVAGIDPHEGRLKEFCTRHSVANAFQSVEEAIAWGEFDAVSNVTPDSVHYVTTLPFLAAGKHVLCEKPLAVSEADASEMAAKATAAGVVNMVNLTYRNVPALNKAAAMIAAGDIGPIRHFEAAYLQSWLTQPAWGEWSEQSQWLWRLSTAHGSNGVLGDIGVHIVDFATHAAGLEVAEVSCRLTTFDKAPGGRIGEYVLDANDSFAMHMSLEGGATGVVHATRFASGHINDLSLRIFGTKGGLEVRFEQNESHLRACLEPDLMTGRWHDVDCPPVRTNYQRFIDAIREGHPVYPDFRRGAKLQRVLDLAVASDAQGGLNQVV
jgi:predicted dehydrogenase